MRFFLSPSIRKSLVLLVLFAVFPALGIILHMGRQLRNNQVADAENFILQQVQAMAAHHERIVDNARLLLMTLAKAAEVRALDGKGGKALLGDMLARNPAYVSLILADAEGRVIAAAPEAVHASIREKKYFQEAMRRQAFVVEDYTLDLPRHRVVVWFAQPVFSETGQLTGLLAAAFDLSYFGKIFAGVRLPPGSVFTLTDISGIRLTRFPEAEKYTWVPDLPRMVAHMSRQREEGVFLETGVDGVRRLYSYKRLHFEGASFPYLMIRLGIPVDRALAEAESVLLRSVGLLVLATVLALALAWLVGRLTIMRRMDRLMAATDRLRGGDLSARVGIAASEGELGHLAAAFDGMAEGLEVKERERRRASEDLLRLNEELESRVELRTRELDTANKDLQAVLQDLRQAQGRLVLSEKLAALGELVAGVAHEINTPVGVALSAASTLAEKSQAINGLFAANEMKRSDLARYMEEAEEGTGMIIINLHRASEMIRSFKMVAADQISESRRVFNVRNYIEELLISLRPKLKKTRVRVELHCDPDLTLESYPGAFSQVLTNLIINSLTHAFAPEDEGIITISAELSGDLLVCRYQDNGKGIPAEARARIFEPFFTTARGRGSTGLGMHIVFNIVTHTLGGSIACESEPGQGVDFRIEIPVPGGHSHV